MTLPISSYLKEIALREGLSPEGMQFPDCAPDPAQIRVMMINEVVPKNPEDWFYSKTADPENRRNALGLFASAGFPVQSMEDILGMGIYITAAMKTPKASAIPDPAVMHAHLPLLAAELALFPNLKLVMLMGDVAVKMLNQIAKAQTGKNACPVGPAGRRRHWGGEAFLWGGIRVMPSYIMTGKNLLIEPFKRDTIAEDIRRMMAAL
jgi:uracil-DNA glycosylase